MHGLHNIDPESAASYSIKPHSTQRLNVCGKSSGRGSTCLVGTVDAVVVVIVVVVVVVVEVEYTWQELCEATY